MPKSLFVTTRAYLAGFLDGDGSIYVRAKPNDSYRYGFQVAPYIVLFQSSKDRSSFEKICSMIGYGHMRERNDGILEYIINRIDDIQEFLASIAPYVIMKRKQLKLMLKIIMMKKQVKNERDFENLLMLIDNFRQLNYSKRRKRRTLTP